MNTNSELLDYITRKYEVYENTKITMQILEDISTKENIEMRDLLCLLEINRDTVYRLRKKKQKTTILKFNKCININCKKIILKQNINRDEFINLRNKLNIKDYTLVKRLGISMYKYYKLKNNEINETRVIDVKLKHKVDLIKIDLKYKKQEYYSKQELEDICKKRNIQLEEFIKYYNTNLKHYKLNKVIIEKSPKGLWIGKSIKIPNEFFEQNFCEIQRKLYGVIKKYNYIMNWYMYKEDLVAEAIINILGRDGEIVKKFYFDKNLTINILVVKCKYIMFGNYMKMYKNKNIYYDEYENSFLEHSNWLRDDRYNPENLVR